MADYKVPQVEIHQMFDQIPAAVSQSQIAFLFGPNYILHRYKKDNIAASAEYTAEDVASTETDASKHEIVLKFQDPQDLTQINVDSIKVFAGTAIVGLTEPIYDKNALPKEGENEADTGKAPYLIKDNTIEFHYDVPDVGDSLVISDALKEATVGRHLYIEYTKNATTKKVLAEIVDSIRDMTKEGENDKIRLAFVLDEYFDTDVTAADITKIVPCEVQKDVEIPHNDFTDLNKMNTFWEYKTDKPTLATDTNFEEQNNGEPYVAFKKKVELPCIDLDHDTKYGRLYAADLYVEYKELTTSRASTITAIDNIADVPTLLGTVSVENPLAQAVYNAMLNAGGQTVRFMAIPTDDKEGYLKVLEAASLTKDVYLMTPVTRDHDIITLVKSHVEAMSEAGKKRWRIAIVSEDVPNIDYIYSKENNTDGSDFLMKILEIKTPTGSDVQQVTVQFVQKYGASYDGDPDVLFKKWVKENDVLKTLFDNQEYGKPAPAELKIVLIKNNNTLVVEDPKNMFDSEDLASNRVLPAEIYHVLTDAEKADTYASISAQLATRRVYNVFPTQFIGSDGELQSGEFAAACVAGLISSCLPHQPVTNLALTGIKDIPLTYQTYTPDQLNTIARGGTFIVTQDLPLDQVYVRHQISTAYKENNLNTAELSVTRNVDSISYFFDNLLSPYIGKYNITPDLLNAIRSVIVSGLTSLSRTNYGLYGPQVIAEGTEILLLEQDALLKDHVNCDLKLNIPYPFNFLVLKLFV